MKVLLRHCRTSLKGEPLIQFGPHRGYHILNRWGISLRLPGNRVLNVFGGFYRAT